MNNSEVQRMYLQNFAAAYGDEVLRPQGEIYRVVNPLLRDAARGKVLLIGAGSITHAVGANATYLVALDYSESMLRQGKWGGGAAPLCADAGNLPFDRGTFDTVVLPFVIHHLGGDSVVDTDKAVERVIGEACRVLRPGGRLLIVDLFLGEFLESTQRAVYGAATKILNAYGKPNMFFYSVGNLLQLIRDTRMRVEVSRRLTMTEPLVLTLLAPKWKIKPWAHPAKFHFIQCVKVL